MLLAIDIGNSTISLGLLDKDKLFFKHKFLTDKSAKATSYEKTFKSFFQDINNVDGVIISSVVPKIDPVFKSAVKKIFKLDPIFVNSNIKLGIEVKVKQPAEIGADRLVNTCAAHHSFKGNLIVIDFGTATTFDFVTKNGDFLGGVIAPGINMSAKALFENTDKLKDVSPSRIKKIIGRDTVSAIKSGIYFGYIGLTEKIVSEIKRDVGCKVKVIATGGAYPIVKNDLKIIDKFDENLIFKGLQKIYLLNS